MNKIYKPAFLVDFMLGKLARWLRIFGFNTLYADDKSRMNVILQSLKENRILLTRNHRLSKKRAFKLVVIKSDHLNEQLKQVIDDVGIIVKKENLFTRCTLCNEINEIIKSKEEIKSMVPEYVYNTQNDFSRCPKCKRIYWPGTHWDLLLNDLEKTGIKLL